MEIADQDIPQLRAEPHHPIDHPALKPEFFERLARDLQDRFLVVLARLGDERIAMGLFLKGGGRLYGRYWGCTRDVPSLHFETAYYQGIDYCIEHGLQVFESGAKGEHKIARGFLPCRTRSHHHVRHPAFRNAIADFLSREGAWMEEYRDSLMQHSPYRQDAP
jgi:hypothetical protein